MPATKHASEFRTAPSPSTASTASMCSSGGSSSPLDESKSAPSPFLPLLCGPLSPPLRHHASSFQSIPSPRSSAPSQQPSQSSQPSQEPSQPSQEPSTPRVGSAARASYNHLLQRSKLPQCLRFRRKRPAPRVYEHDGARASCASVGSAGSGCGSSARASPASKQRPFGTVLLHESHADLDLFRDEAEYSDYLVARLTGMHSEIDGVVFYEVELRLHRLRWTVLRRFSEFRALRQRLRKHLARRLRAGSGGGGCAICANILQSIDSTAFPSRRQDPPAPLALVLSAVRRAWTASTSASSSPPVVADAAAPGCGCGSGSGSGSGSSTTRDSALSVRPALSSGEPSRPERYVAVIEMRKAMLQEFVGACLLSVRSLRQHFQALPEACAAACEIGIALRLIEEFFGLSFTRYLHFLSERGVDVEP